MSAVTKAEKVAVDGGWMNRRPPGVSVKDAQAYLGVFEAPKVANRKLLGALVLVSAVAAFEALAMFRMVPLHERIPYAVTVDATTGNVTPSSTDFKEFHPTDANKRYFLNKWVTDLLTVDTGTRDRLPESFAMLRGAAVPEWKSFIFDTYKPLDRIHQNDQLRVYPTTMAIGFIGDDSAVIRVALHDASNTDTRHLLVTVKFAILPPQSDAQVYHNSIGLWITHFQVTDETNPS